MSKKICGGQIGGGAWSSGNQETRVEDVISSNLTPNTGWLIFSNLL